MDFSTGKNLQRISLTRAQNRNPISLSLAFFLLQITIYTGKFYHSNHSHSHQLEVQSQQWWLHWIWANIYWLNISHVFNTWSNALPKVNYCLHLANLFLESFLQRSISTFASRGERRQIQTKLSNTTPKLRSQCRPRPQMADSTISNLPK